MNDCLWCFIVCGGHQCNGCSQYKSVNSKEGSELHDKYNEVIREQASNFATLHGFDANKRPPIGGDSSE